MPILAALADTVADLTERFGYLGLFMVMVAENLFPPIPSEVVLPLAGFEVSRGTLGFGGALATATAGSVAGALILYALGRAGGRPLILRYGRVLRITPAGLDRAEDWFDRYGAWVVLLGRLIPGVRSIVSVPAGIARMPLIRFVLLTSLGSLFWNALLISTGRALGSNWERVAVFVGPLSRYVVLIVVAGLAVLLARHLYIARARKT